MEILSPQEYQVLVPVMTVSLVKKLSLVLEWSEAEVEERQRYLTQTSGGTRSLLQGNVGGAPHLLPSLLQESASQCKFYPASDCV